MNQYGDPWPFLEHHQQIHVPKTLKILWPFLEHQQANSIQMYKLLATLWGQNLHKNCIGQNKFKQITVG